MLSEESSGSEIGIQQSNSLSQAWKDFKDSIFNVLFVILDKNEEGEEEQSLLGLTFESGLDYLQMLAFPFSMLVLDAWNGGQTVKNAVQFFSSISITYYLPGQPYFVYLLVLYGLIFIIILIIIDVVYVSYSFQKKKFKFTFPLVLLAKIVPLFVTILFLPITQTLLSVVECQKQTNGTLVMKNYTNVICWEGWHLFHSVITMVFATIFVIVSCVVALALYEPRIISKKLTARKNSNGELIFIFTKLVCQFFFSFKPFEGTFFYVVLLFLLSFWVYWSYNVKRPYYSRKATKFYRITSTYYFWTTLMLLVGELSRSFDFRASFIIWLGGLPFIAFMIHFDNKKDIQRIEITNLKFKSGDKLEQHLNEILQLIDTYEQDGNAYVLLMGYIERHQEICQEMKCALKKIINKKNEREMKIKQLVEEVEKMFNNGLKKFPQSTKLRMSYAYFYLEFMKKKEKAFQQFTNAEKMQPSFDEQFHIYRFKKKIRETLENKEEGNESNLIETIKFENYVSLCEESMVRSAKLHKQFWAELKQQIPSLNKLNSIGGKITQTSNSVKENYIQLSKINNSSYEILNNYAIYLLLISEDNNLGNELLTNAKKIYQDKIMGCGKKDTLQFEINSLDKSTDSVMVVSLLDDEFGKIINFNMMFSEMTGYQKSDLLGKSKDRLKPKSYGGGYSNNFLSLNKCKNNKQSHKQIIVSKLGYLIPIEYSFYLKEHEQGAVYIFIKIASQLNKNILFMTNPMGKITDFNLIGQTFIKNCDDIKKVKFPQYAGGGSFCLNLKIGETTKMYNIEVNIIQNQVIQNYNQDQDQNEESKLIQVCTGFIVNMFEVEGDTSRKVQNKYEIFQKDKKKGSIDKSVIQSGQKVEVDNELIDLYQEPNLFEVFVNKLTTTKVEEYQKPQFELKTKIKIMRLVKNQVKMVYNQQIGEVDKNNQRFEQSQQQRQNSKFNDESFQLKLRTAINTDLNHDEVSSLRYFSIVFILVIFILNILALLDQYSEVAKISDFTSEVNLKSKDYTRLTANLMNALDSTSNFTQQYQQNLNLTTDFKGQQLISLHLDHNYTIQKTLRDSVTLFQSRLLQFFQNPQNLTQISELYENYLSSIYPSFYQNLTKVNLRPYILWIISSIIFCCSVVMMISWIYIDLKISKKNYDIIIWFLDIPIPYVIHLSNHCDQYLKEFVPAKELKHKGLDLSDNENTIVQDEYKNGTEDEELEEQIKARKSLIAKYKKETLCNKVNLSSCKVSWVLMYSLLYVMLVIVLSQQFYQEFDRLSPSWKIIEESIITDNTLYLALNIQKQNIDVGNTDIVSIVSFIKQNHLNIMTKNQLQDFNQQVIDNSHQEVDRQVKKVYYNDICTLGETVIRDQDQCESILHGKLRSGYFGFSKYLISLEEEDTADIRTACQYYTTPLLIQILEVWTSSIASDEDTFIHLISIMLYVFIVVTIFLFLLLWLYYLRRLNVRLNQTVQMLNMIPFKLLPKARKQTKDFIDWIIRQANKKKHHLE